MKKEEEVTVTYVKTSFDDRDSGGFKLETKRQYTQQHAHNDNANILMFSRHNLYHVVLMSTKNKVQQRLIGMSLVYQVFGIDLKARVQ